MKIEQVILYNFRNHKSFTYLPHEGLNVIVANNGKGKTNLLESIYYCSFGKSFRTNNDNDLITTGESEFIINLKVNNNESSHEIGASYKNKKKIFFLDKKPIKKISDLNHYLNVLLFEPNQVSLFTSEPINRRSFLDVLVSKISTHYLDLLKRYKNLLKERNSALKETKVDKIYVFTLTNQMIAISEEITDIRLKFIKEINLALEKVAEKISNKKQSLKLRYYPIIEYSEKYKEDLLRKYQETYEEDVLAKSTTIGVHKEDYVMLLNGKNIAQHGSQGENRLAVLSMILSLYFIKNSRKPIVILDDVLSELDEENQNRLIDFVKNFDQTFITTTRSLDIDNEFNM
mgnify:CR=1 FL=1